MAYKFYCPSTFEIPKSFRKKTKVFGMGRRAAETLGKELANLPADITPVIFGCAGALRDSIKAGEIFQITKLGDAELTPIPNFQSASLASAEKILKTPNEKQKFREATKADLVDLEMEFIWNATSPEIRERIIFIRGVIDKSNHDISFLGTKGVDWKKLLKPNQFINFVKFVGNWRKYLLEIEKRLQEFPE